MNDHTPRLNPNLEAAAKELSDWWAVREKELDRVNAVNEPLFHYTDMRGMLGIIGGEKMWFTSIFHLNDPSELAYGIDMALEILRERSEQGSAVVKNFCAWMAHVLVKAGGEIFGFFVASFSRAPDELGQWRAYADNGRGVAIGLAPTLFRVEEKQDTLGVTEKTIIARVIYDRADSMRNLSEAIDRAVALIVSGDVHVTSNDERQEFGKELARLLAVPIFYYAMSCKHHAYGQEQETRLLLINDLEHLGPHTELRTRGSSLVPYIASPMRVRASGAITKLMIGPASDALADDAIRAFLRKYGLPEHVIERSDIPYTAR